MNSSFSQTDGHSATLIENSSNIYFFLLIFNLKLQNRTNQEE